MALAARASTSPNEQATRNGGSACAASTRTTCFNFPEWTSHSEPDARHNEARRAACVFQLPRVDEPLGTPPTPAFHSPCSTGFNFPEWTSHSGPADAHRAGPGHLVVSTSPSGQATRNPVFHVGIHVRVNDVSTSPSERVTRNSGSMIPCPAALFKLLCAQRTQRIGRPAPDPL